VNALNPYRLGAIALAIIAVLFLFTRQMLWALPFGGGALVLYFLGMSQTLDNGDDDARR
jgi:hypothetical protein